MRQTLWVIIVSFSIANISAVVTAEHDDIFLEKTMSDGSKYYDTPETGYDEYYFPELNTYLSCKTVIMVPEYYGKPKYPCWINNQSNMTITSVGLNDQGSIRYSAQANKFLQYSMYNFAQNDSLMIGPNQTTHFLIEDDSRVNFSVKSHSVYQVNMSMIDENRERFEFNLIPHIGNNTFSKMMFLYWIEPLDDPKLNLSLDESGNLILQERVDNYYRLKIYDTDGEILFDSFSGTSAILSSDEKISSNKYRCDDGYCITLEYPDYHQQVDSDLIEKILKECSCYRDDYVLEFQDWISRHPRKPEQVQNYSVAITISASDYGIYPPLSSAQGISTLSSAMLGGLILGIGIRTLRK